MKIALALHSLDPATGGVATATVQLALALSRRAHTVTLITFDTPNAPFLGELPQNIPLIALGPVQNAYGYIPDLEKKLSAHTTAFDFLILNGLWLFSTAGMSRWAQQNKIPYALFPHGMLDPYFARAHPLKHLKKLIYWLMAEQHTVRHAAAVYYTTPSEMSLAQKTFPFFRPRHQEVIGLGLQSSLTPIESAKETFLAKFPMLRSQSYLLYLGRFHPKKGADMLLVALEDFPHLTLVMAGPLHDTSTPYLKTLMSLSNHRVIWTDLLTGPAKWGALAAADALILPSHQENFGMVAAEALSVGTPVLASHPVAIAAEIVSSNAGFSAPDTLAGTRSLIEKFTTCSEADKKTLRINARTCYEKNYQPDAIALKLEGSIASLK